MSLRVAFAGKGGSGKSVISGMFARFLARSGADVLALDSDPMPGMSFSLGLGNVDLAIPDDAVVEQPEGSVGPRFILREGLSVLEAMERYSIEAPDGVRYLQFGKLGSQVRSLPRSQAAFMQIASEFPRGTWSLVGDLPGGTRQLFFGWARYADILIVVVEPTSKSIISAKRLMRLAGGKDAPSEIVVVVNKVQQSRDREVVGSKTGLEVIGEIPFDVTVSEADWLGVSPMDHTPNAPAVLAVGSLVEVVVSRDNGRLSAKSKTG